MRVAIGEITAPQGVRGEVRVLPLTDFPERFESLTEIWLGSPWDEMVPIESVRPHKGFMLVKFRGVNDRDQAEALRGLRLEISEQDLVPLKPGEYYVHQLQGCQVLTVEGRSLGQLVDVYRTGANDVWVVQGDVSRGEAAEVLIPALKDVVREVDLAARRLVIAPLPGLLD
ncbi:MAG: ribosome maturation factor RimM [Symbiobacteriia bacterium]